MAALVWDQIGEKVYEAGVSKGVLYSDNVAVAWNGLTSIEENTDAEVEPVYFDGVKINDIITLGDYSATLKALTYPDEFLRHQGIFEDLPGLYVLDQPMSRFGLSYRTEVGSDLDGDAGYKIHLAYGLTAIPSSRTFETLSDDANPSEFEWEITAIPQELEGYRPTAHVVLDSRSMVPAMLADLESILYGSAEEEARLPSLRRLYIFLNGWNRLIITDNEDGTWTAIDPNGNYINIIDDTTFEIVTDSATYLDADTYTISSSERGGGV